MLLLWMRMAVVVSSTAIPNQFMIARICVMAMACSLSIFVCEYSRHTPRLCPRHHSECSENWLRKFSSSHIQIRSSDVITLTNRPNYYDLFLLVICQWLFRHHCDDFVHLFFFFASFGLGALFNYQKMCGAVTNCEQIAAGRCLMFVLSLSRSCIAFTHSLIQK